MERLRHLVALIALSVLAFAGGPTAAISMTGADIAQAEMPSTHATTVDAASESDCVHCLKNDAAGAGSLLHESSCCDAYCKGFAVLAGHRSNAMQTTVATETADLPSLSGKIPPIHLPPPLAA
jgi:hypothetical protein